MEKLAERIKALRLERGMTQVQLGDAVGLDQRFISNIESGRKSVSVETLIIFANFFKVTMDYLVGRTDTL